MDPNATLKSIRELANMMAQGNDSEVSVELTEAIDNLDTWLSAGGFLPADWAR